MVSPEGETTESLLWQPGESYGKEQQYPTTCWRPDTTIEDVIKLPLPDEATSGDWWISLSVFGDETQPDGRLAVSTYAAEPDIQVGLGPVQVDG